MGCSSSKDAVQPITVKNGVVKPASGKARKIKVQGSDGTAVHADDALHINSAKSTSAKSRDSGIDGMDGSGLPDGVITEESDPHLITEVEGDRRPGTPNLSLVGSKFSSGNIARERMKSKAILEELESQGLITGSKVVSGGATFEVDARTPGILEPLSPLRPPARLERLNQDKAPLTKEELEFKQLQAEMRRQKSMHKPKKRSRLASQLAKDKEMADNMEPNGENVNPEDGSAYKFDDEDINDPFKSRHQIPHE